MLTREQYASLLNNDNVQRALNTLSTAEGTSKYSNPYSTAFGGVQVGDLSKHPSLSQSYTDLSGKKLNTTAAGKYQFTAGTYSDIAGPLGLEDFGPTSQDIAAVAAIDRAGALGDVLSGNVQGFVDKTGSTWASLPSSPYAQPKVSAATINNAWNATPTTSTYSPDVSAMTSFANSLAPTGAFVGPFDAALNTAPPSDKVVGDPFSQMKSDLQAQAASMANATPSQMGTLAQGLYTQAASYDPTQNNVVGAAVPAGQFDPSRFGFDPSRFGAQLPTTVATPQALAPPTATAYADPQVSANPAHAAINAATMAPQAQMAGTHLQSLLGGITAQDQANALTDSAHLSALQGQDARNTKIGGLLGLGVGSLAAGPIGGLLGLLAGRMLTPSAASGFFPTAPTAPTSFSPGYSQDNGNHSRSSLIGSVQNLNAAHQWDGTTSSGASAYGSSGQLRGAVDSGTGGLW